MWLMLKPHTDVAYLSLNLPLRGCGGGNYDSPLGNTVAKFMQAITKSIDVKVQLQCG